MSTQTVSPHAGDKRSVLNRALGGSAGRSLGLVIALLALFVVGTITAGDRFASVDNIFTIIRFASIIGVISIGMTFVITAGGIDLSVGSVLGLASVVATLSWVQQFATSTNWIVMVIVAIAVGGLAGLINGIVIAYGNVVAFIATLAMLVAARGLAEVLANRTTQIVIEPGFLSAMRGELIGVPILVWIFVVVVAAGWFILTAPPSAAAPSPSAATSKPHAWPASKSNATSCTCTSSPASPPESPPS